MRNMQAHNRQIDSIQLLVISLNSGRDGPSKVPWEGVNVAGAVDHQAPIDPAVAPRNALSLHQLNLNQMSLKPERSMHVFMADVMKTESQTPGRLRTITQRPHPICKFGLEERCLPLQPAWFAK